jgi:hypothetical protein
VVPKRKGSPKDMLFELRMRDREVLQVNVELRVPIHVEHTLIGTTRHHGHIPWPLTVMSVESVKAALRSAESEVADKPLSDAVGLQPGKIRIFRLCLLPVEEFKSADAEVPILTEPVAKVALLEEGGGRISIVSIRGVIGCAESHLASSSHR